MLKCPELVRDVEFFVNITQHLNILSEVLQSNGMLVTEYYDSVQVDVVSLAGTIGRW